MRLFYCCFRFYLYLECGLYFSDTCFQPGSSFFVVVYLIINENAGELQFLVSERQNANNHQYTKIKHI